MGKILFLMMFTFVSSAADLTGDWSGTIKPGPRGPVANISLKLKQHGENISGSMTIEGRQSAIENGQVRGDELTFEVGKRPIFLKVTEEDRLNGELKSDKGGLPLKLEFTRPKYRVRPVTSGPV